MTQCEKQTSRGVYISTYGCQMNVNDSERMMSLLEMADYQSVDAPERADVIIINACSVREKPVHKVYSEVGLYRKLKEKNPLLKIGVGGCVGQQEKDRLMKQQPLIDFVFGTDNIDELPSLVRRLYEGPGKIVDARFKNREPYHIETLVRNPGVSTFVNIMKGCDNFCTFCIVPFTRGREKSRPAQHILADIRLLVKRGVKEVTLLGQNVNSYRDEGVDFADLLDMVATESGLTRLRYTTSHPKDFNEKLVGVMLKHRQMLGDYIHLPMQSGSTGILERMNRGYSGPEYLEKVAMIRAALPEVSLSTDLIVGFPGETEEDFLDTLRLVHESKFESIFAFKYSPRPFTKAEKFTDQVPEAVKDDRLQRLFAAHDEQALILAKKYDGLEMPVLVEKFQEGGKLSGRNAQNKLVHFMGEATDLGQLVPVKITNSLPYVMRGEKVP